MSRRARGSAPPRRWSRERRQPRLAQARPRRPRAASTPSARAATGPRPGSSPEPAATASASSARGEGKRTLAHTPSRRPGVAPSPLESRCATQRSTPRVGTATSSGANGSGSGSASSARSASTRPSARSARWRCSIVTIHPMSRSGPSGPDSLIEGTPGAPFEDEVDVVRLALGERRDRASPWSTPSATATRSCSSGRSRTSRRASACACRDWQDDRRFGLQVQGRRSPSRSPPSGDAALLAYLSASSTSARAAPRKLLDRHGEDVLEAIDRDPRAAFRAAGLEPAAHDARRSRSWDGLRSTRALHLLLAPHGLAWLVPRIDEGATASARTRVVRERPVRAHERVRRRLRTRPTRSPAPAACPRDSPARARAAVLHVLAEAERDGSTCLPVAELARARGRAAGLRARRRAPARDGASDGELVLEVDGDGAVWAYRPPTAALEAELAGAGRSRCCGSRARRCKLPGEPPPADARPGAGAVRRRPGRVRLPPLDRHGRPGHRQDGDDPADLRRRGRAEGLGRCSSRPTGRAARRMAESTGLEASTVHSALGWIPGQGPTVEELDARPADRRRDVDGEPRAARHAAARRRAAHARGARRRRRPARAGRRRQAVRRAGRRARAVPVARAHAHLPPGGGEHDRPRRPRRPPRATPPSFAPRGRPRRTTSS